MSRRQNEWDQIQDVIPDLDMVPDFVTGGSSANAALEPDEFAVLASVDGRRSIRDLAEDLGEIRGWVADSGEGRWTVQEAIDLDVPAPIITLSLLTRFRSRQPESYSARVLAALRQQFGGHAVKTDTDGH